MIYVKELVRSGLPDVMNIILISLEYFVDDLRNSIIEDCKNYDIVVIDVQGRDSKSLRTSLLISDIVYIPFIPSQNDIETIEELAELLEETQIQNTERKTLYILNQCSSHYLDHTNDEAYSFLQEYEIILKRSQAMIFHRKLYKIAAAEGLGGFDTTDTKSKKEIENYV